MSTLNLNQSGPEKQAWAKIATGLLLAAAGTVGIVFGKSVKQRFLRISILILSALSLATGLYLFVSGTTDLALGVADQMVLKEDNLQAIAKREAPVPTATQTMTFPGPNFFKLSLRPLAHQKATENLRRLRYECADGSESFTVFITRFGIFGIPDESVTCADGSLLIDYDPSKGYVIGISQ